MASRDHFEYELRSQFTDATTRGATHIVISVSELTIAVSHHPTADDLERCKEAMEKVMGSPRDTIIDEGEGRLTIRYALPRL
jgi:hypothetical protein